MKKLFLLLLTFCLCSIVHAQSTFEKIIDTLGFAYAKCVQQTFDGGFIVCGTSNYNGHDAAVAKLDSTGTIEWAKIFTGPGDEQAQYVAQTPDSGYIVDAIYDEGSNAKNWLLRLDANGDTVWTKILSAGTAASSPTQMAVSNNGNYGLVGYYKVSATSFTKACLIITDNAGMMQSSKIYPAPYAADANGIDNASQNNFIIAGAIGTNASYSDVYLFKTDSLGDTLWTRSYDNSTQETAFAVEQTTAGGFILAGIIMNSTTGKFNVYLINTKPNGDTLWKKMYGGITGCEAYSVNECADGGYIVTGRIVNGNPLQADVYLLKTNANGDTLWTRQFDNSPEDRGNYVRQTKDGGYIIAGLQSATSGLYLIKTDSMGLVNTGTGITDVNNPLVFSVFPNPSTGNFTVQLKNIPYNNAVIEIYNLYNESIYSRAVNKNTTFEMDLSNSAEEMYIVMLRTKESLFSKKIVIQK